MADAIGLLRQSAASGTWFDLCGVPIGSALGRTEFCRIGCDVGLDWDGAAYMRGTGRERVSTKNSLANTRGRAHLDGRAFRCDPDVFFLRPDVRLTDEQRAELLEADSTLGGVLFVAVGRRPTRSLLARVGMRQRDSPFVSSQDVCHDVVRELVDAGHL